MKFLVVFFFTLLGGALWSVSQLFVEAELTVKWYWTIFCLTLGILFLAIQQNYYIPERDKHGRIFSALSVVITFCAASQAVYGILQWWGICNGNNGFRVTGSFDNPAGVASALAFSVPFALHLLGDTQKRVRLFAGGSLLLLVVAVIFSESRAGILSVAVVAGLYLITKLKKGRKPVIIGMLIGLFLLTVNLYFYKQNSADGRLLVWKCTLEMIKENPSGYGPGGFEANYMYYQARHFRAHPNSEYAILADDVKRPFNEYLKIFVDYGWAGGAILLFLGIGVMRLKQGYAGWSSRTVSLCLLSIATFSFFSYPFRYPHTWILCLFSLVVLVYNVRPLSIKLRQKVAVILVCVLCVGSWFMLNRMYSEMLWRKVATDSLWGGDAEYTLPVYAKLYHDLGEEPLFLYNYAAELNVAGNYEESIRIGKECEMIYADYYLQMLLANSYKHLGNYSDAEKHWILASEMCPNRFIPLYERYKMHEALGDTLHTQQLASTILSKPVKVNSPEIARILSEIKQKTTYKDYNINTTFAK